MVIWSDPHIPTVKEIHRYSSQYSAHLSTHLIDLVVNLMEQPEQAIAKTPTKWSAYQIPSVTAHL
jgi:hypothetical protein